MKKLNRPFGPPHFPPAVGYLLRRKLFLDKKSKFKTFWGPGQLRDDRWCAVVVIDGKVFDFNGYIKNPNIYPNANSSYYYNPPTDWRPKETPLIPPQVVHINLKVEEAFSNIKTTVGGKFVDNWELFTADYEPATVEHKRLLAIAKEVKTDIEKIRIGKTWVEINDYFEDSVDNGGGYNPEFQTFADGSFYNDIESPPRLNLVDNGGGNFDEHLFLDTPTPFDDIFFGTNILGIYLGDNSFEPQYDHGEYFGATTFEETIVWRIISDALLKTVNYFYGYSQILFPCDIGTFINTEYQKNQNDYFASLGGISIEVFPRVTVNFLDQVPDNAVLVIPLESGGYNVYLNESSESIPEVLEFIPTIIPITPSGTIFPKVVQWGKDNKIDITMPGDTSTIASKDTLINLIAKHYKFNPETGKDIIN